MEKKEIFQLFESKNGEQLMFTPVITVNITNKLVLYFFGYFKIPTNHLSFKLYIFPF